MLAHRCTSYVVIIIITITIGINTTDTQDIAEIRYHGWQLVQAGPFDLINHCQRKTLCPQV